MSGTTPEPFDSLRDLVLHFGRRRGWSTQRHIAIECEVDETALSRFLNGEQDPGSCRTFRIFRHIGVPLESFEHAYMLLETEQTAAQQRRLQRTAVLRQTVRRIAPRVAVAVAALGLGSLLLLTVLGPLATSNRGGNVAAVPPVQRTGFEAPPATAPDIAGAAPSPEPDRQGGASGPAPGAATVPLTQPDRVQRDDFTDPDAGLLPRESRSPARYRAGYDAGEYRIETVPSPDGEVAAVSVRGTYRDATIAVNVRFEGPTTERYAFVGCRDSDRGGYEVRLDPETGRFLLRRWDGQQQTALLSGDGVRTGLASNRVELRCTGDEISVRINGIDKGRVTDTTYRDGSLYLGVGARAGAGGSATVRFANLVVTRP